MRPLSQRGMRRLVIALTMLAVVLVVSGALAGWLWLTGIGVWVLITAFLLELIYRP
ncbi:hypothetical protein [Streptomyces lavendulocolor]|uniref:hypothetical protein n=1 Tax=Streptomyces lavendulocolor TaxID=67316 RepID=UPI003C2ADEBC